MGPITNFKRYLRKRKTKKYMETVRTLAKRKVGGKLTGGRTTIPLYQRGLLNQTERPVRRHPHRDKQILETLRLLRDINPDASMAVWNFLRLANQGHSVEVTDTRGDNDDEMQTYLNEELAPRLGKLYSGGTDQLINVLNLTAYTEGAEALEVELSENLEEVIDFHVLSPTGLSFKQSKTNQLELVEKQLDGTDKVLNPNQVFYVPIDPDVDDPYGRSPMLPAVETIIFQAEVLRDLKAVAHHQGHARFDISVSTEAIINNIPESIQNQGEQAVVAFIDSYMNGVESSFNDLEATDDFYHDNTMTIQTVGGISGKSMDAKVLIDIINQQVVTSLKQLPILLGRNEGTTETHGSIQWEIHISGVKSIQNVTQRLLEKAYTVALQVKGSQSKVSVTFDDVRTKDRKVEAEAEAVEIQNAIAKVTQGWVDNDEAANTIVGHDATGELRKTTFMTVPPQAPKENPVDEDEVSETEALRQVDSHYYHHRKFPSQALFKTRGDSVEIDQEVAAMGDIFAPDLAIIVPQAREVFYKQLRQHLSGIETRLMIAPQPPKFLIKTEASRDEQSERDEEELAKWERKYLRNEEEDVEDWLDTLQEWVEHVADYIAHLNFELTLPNYQLDTIDFELLDWVAWQSENSSIGIVQTSYDAVMSVIKEVLAEGSYSIEKVKVRLHDLFEFSEARANVIARTEVLTAGTTGQFKSDYQLYERGIVIGKVWHSGHDHLTRPAHVEADGQIRAFPEMFEVDGETLLHPRDREHGASAKNVIQCRCFYTRLLAGEDDSLEKGGE